MTLPTDVAVRAALTQTLLKAVSRLPEAERATIERKIGAQTLRDVHGMLPVIWISMDVHMRICDVVREVVGPQRNVTVWTETMADIWRRPLLRSFVEMSQNIFGATPAGLFRQAQRVVQHLTRNAGVLTYEARSECNGVMTFKDFPARRYTFICFLEGTQGALQALFELFGTTGTVTLESYDDARATAEYSMRWLARRGARVTPAGPSSPI